jgi:hypothetical protein
VNIPFTTAMAVFSKWGTGAGEFVRAMKQQDLLVQAQGQPGTTHETTAVLISGKV